jgi:hypothetical protein
MSVGQELQQQVVRYHGVVHVGQAARSGDDHILEWQMVRLSATPSAKKRPKYRTRIDPYRQMRLSCDRILTRRVHSPRLW